MAPDMAEMTEATLLQHCRYSAPHDGAIYGPARPYCGGRRPGGGGVTHRRCQYSSPRYQRLGWPRLVQHALLIIASFDAASPPIGRGHLATRLARTAQVLAPAGAHVYRVHSRPDRFEG